MTESGTKPIIPQEEVNEMYYVVKNMEEQYSIWPSYKQIPKGWEAVGGSRAKTECLAYIEETWTDMRPLSLRKQMEAIAAKERQEAASMKEKK